MASGKNKSYNQRMNTKTAPEIIHQLVATFEQNLTEYHAQKNETELRREFLDKFFTALGWDVANEKGYDELGKEVVHELSVEVGGRQKKADYAFRVGRGDRFEFLVEAKRPSVKVESNQDAAFQIRRYGWSAKIPINILTDFEHFAVYDCRIKPNHNDKASQGRIKLIHYKEYSSRWQEIVDLFSAEAVRRGALDKYTTGLKGKKGTADVDDAFLEEIEDWREKMARNIALRNQWIDITGLNYAVQVIIDRIVFLRICEERGIEPENQLLGATKSVQIYQNLCALFQKADKKYNSGLFHFEQERNRSSHPDQVTLTLNIDDSVLKDIISNLYYPKSPYAFLYIPADILGQIYERFLGKVIRLTPGHRAKVEEKPEVRKAGGVYYTPTYIVDYIVQNTVGKLVEGKTPKQVAALKILDPACGSGTFLLGAYQFLLDWHLRWYLDNDPEKKEHRQALSPVMRSVQAGIRRASEDAYRLNIAKRKEILTNNIYGVDIDTQAVEVTKLSLLLKVLENTSEQITLTTERVLPDLADNIKCGNSLINFDYFNGQLMPDKEEVARVNPFDWHREFDQVFAQGGGFDAIIGNPPYIRIQAMREWASEQVDFFKKEYQSARKGNYDIYVVFIEKSLTLLNKKGLLGFILPSKFFATDYGANIRGVITKTKALLKIVDFKHFQIFGQATTYTCLLFLTRISQNHFNYATVNSAKELMNTQFTTIENTLTSEPWLFSSNETKTIVKKMDSLSKPLKDLPTRIGRGSSSGSDDIFILKREKDKLQTRQGKDVAIEKGILRTPIYATDFGRYTFRPAEQELIVFPYNVGDDRYDLLSEDSLKELYFKAYQYLLDEKKKLQQRKQYKQWYAFSAPRNLDIHETAQILVPLLADRGLFCRIPKNSSQYCLMASGGFSVTLGNESGLSPNYVLGLLNSTLLFWRLRAISTVFRGGWVTCTKQYIGILPIRLIDFANPAEKAQHDQMVSLVETMLELHQRQAETSTPQEKTALERQIHATDTAIDALVYELYGLTEEEIKIVEG
ncbi:MAG: Eco57I restriction-modification methylase domain-containing protein [Proteobacteria bacterium]|nr:Eco57I restriction-modification methylase domain-containing protein [Pseudomonadota bacterium]